MTQWNEARMPSKAGLRIGDAERDAAVERLGEHFAAGRLTKDEFDERAAKVTEARYDDDLRPLFADLPGPGSHGPGVATIAGGWPGSRERDAWAPRDWRAGKALWQQAPPRFLPMLFVPLFLLAMAAVSLVVFATPWLLIPLFWIALAGHGKRQHRMHSHRMAMCGRHR